MAIISAENIEKFYGDLHVLKGITFSIEKGEVIAITGRSGAGKSTLLNILGTLDNIDRGKLFFDGEEVLFKSQKALAEFRNHKIGFVFQFHHLLPEFTALENVCIPAFIRNTPKEATEKRAKELLDYLGLSDRLQHKPNQMSGGEQQRVAVARALVNAPSVILADEPTGNLDSANSEEILKLIFKLRDDFNQTFIIVTHNEDLAKLSDRTLHMEDGKIL